ncbi:MAG: carbohydrate kinase family protein [Calditrichaeota bacterium]|nr:carbohydrate kinase family protein [Calditrichota bacterium]
MRIAVLGTIIKDRIHPFRGEVTEGFGGVFYSIQALRALCDRDDTIIPISYVGSDFYDRVVDYLKQDERINTDALYRLDAPNNRVELYYKNKHERVEYSLFPMPPLDYQKVQPFLDVDILIVNFISGWDIGLDDLKKVSRNFKGLLAADIHSLTLDRKENGLRVFRKVENLDEWLSGLNIVQCNEREFSQLYSGEVEDFYKEYCFDENKIINLTLGARGSLTVYRADNRVLKIHEKPPAKIKVIDPTGCGDAFSAGFVLEYFKTNDIRRAARKANFVAAVTGSIKGLPDRESIKGILKNFMEKNNA